MAKIWMDKNYVVILPFMVNELKLKGNELLIYAIIYGFSQTEGQTFNGGMQYLMEWTQSTRRGVEKSLQKLREKGLIGRIKRTAKYDYSINLAETEDENNANKVRTKCEQSSYKPMRTKLTSECEQSSYADANKVRIENGDTLLNNNLATQDKYNININNPPKPPKGDNDDKSSIKKVIDTYTSSEELKEALTEYEAMRRKLKKPFTDGAFKLMLRKLDKLASSEEEKVEIVNQSVINGWQGIFPLKDDGARTKSGGSGKSGVLSDWMELYEEELRNEHDKS